MQEGRQLRPGPLACRQWRPPGRAGSALAPASNAACLPCGEAVLLLRAVVANGDFTEYWQYHLRCDCQRTHAALCQEQLPIAA